MAKFHLTIISPTRTLFDDDVDEVILPTGAGQIAVLPHHMPLIAQITHGDIVVKNGGKESVTVVFGGFIYVKNGEDVLIMADEAQHLEELNEAEILEAKKRVLAAKQNAVGNSALLASSEAELSRITTQLRSLRKHSGIRRRRGSESKDFSS